MRAMLTLDVEDWEHANYGQLKGCGGEIASEVRRKAYRMDANIDKWLEILADHDACSTAFVLGEFAEKYPEAVKRLARAGHEIATHGQTHDLIYEMSRETFREFLKKGIGTLGNLLGKTPVGFRAPSWSVDERTPWLCEELAAQGIKYDSSLFPVRTPLFGRKNAPLRLSWDAGVLRIPATVMDFGGFRVPFASGAFFRIMPLPVILYGLERASKNGQPVMIILHPRELDPAHPRLPLSGWERMVHYARLGTTIPKLCAVLENYNWRSIELVCAPILDSGAKPSDN